MKAMNFDKVLENRSFSPVDIDSNETIVIIGVPFFSL